MDTNARPRKSVFALAPLLTFILVFASKTGMAQLTFGDWSYTISGSSVIITRYMGFDADVAIPSTINGLPVHYIDIAAFSGKSTITNAFIPSSVTGVLNGTGIVPFGSCLNLMSITVDPQNFAFSSLNGVFFNKKQTSLLEYPLGRLGSYEIPVGVGRVASYAFYGCTNLTSVKIPNTVTNLMSYSFHGCSALNSITIPASVAAIGDFAFTGCDYLTNIFFAGNAPAVWDGPVFSPEWVILPKTMYYVPGTIGWGPTYAGYQTAPLTFTLSAATIQAGQFSFYVSGPAGISAIVESSPSLNGGWVAIQTNTLAGGSFYFSDPDSANYPTQFYRVRME